MPDRRCSDSPGFAEGFGAEAIGRLVVHERVCRQVELDRAIECERDVGCVGHGPRGGAAGSLVERVGPAALLDDEERGLGDRALSVEVHR